MRVALIAHSNSPWAAPYSRYFLAQGHPLILVSFHPRPIPGVPTEFVGGEKADGTTPKSLYLRRVPRVRSLLRRWNPDVVLATYLRSNGLIGALTKCSALVVSSRGADQDWALPMGLGRCLTRWIGDRAELIHASSPELEESLTSLGIERDKIAVVPLGVDSREFTPRPGPRAAGPARILCLRKHFPIYDNDTIVRALARLKAEGFLFECRFAASGPTLPLTQRLAGDLGLSTRVRFVGELEPSQVRDQLHWTDIYVSASLSDGAPSSLFEAMSCGVFPVVSDIRANRDWVVHGQTAYLCRVGQASDFAEGIRFAWADPARREAAAAINRLLIETRCDRAAGLRKIDELLQRAIALYRRKL